MGRAAQVLHISQPSLSISITNLEKELNVQLFHRIGCISPVLYDYLPTKIREFMALPKNRDLKIDFTTDNTSILVTKLGDGYFVFLICSETPGNDLLQTSIIEEPFVLLCPPGREIPESWRALLEKDLIWYSAGLPTPRPGRRKHCLTGFPWFRLWHRSSDRGFRAF